MTENPKKLCFVISPIGDPDSPIRKRSDQILKFLIRPAAEPLGYEAKRADEISEPGTITSQVIQRLIDAPLVVADLTTHNPNVFYELAVRHAIRKPLVQIIDDAESIPFDVSTARTIKFSHRDLDSVERAKAELARQIQAVEKDPTLVDNPISSAVDLAALKTTGKSGEAQLAAMLEGLMAEVVSIKAYLTPHWPSGFLGGSSGGMAVSVPYGSDFSDFRLVRIPKTAWTVRGAEIVRGAETEEGKEER